MPCRSLAIAFAGLMLAAGAAPRAAAGAPLLDGTPVLTFPAIDALRLLAEDEAEAEQGPIALRYAEPLDVALSQDDSGAWDTLPDGTRRWRLRVRVPAATDLGFGFTRADLPEGASLTVSSDGAPVAMTRGPYTARDVHAGELWIPVVPGESAIIELREPAREKSADLLLTRIGAGYRDLFGIGGGTIPRPASGSCNNDVICPVGDPWRAQIDSVAVWALGATRLCTGTMVMDVPGDFTPYFLTANHCGATASNAASVTVYWNFQTSVCGGAPDGSLAHSQSGATLRASERNSDFCLLELASAPDPAFNVFWSGWDRSDTAPGGSVGIHHPSTDEKRITFNTDPLTKGNDCAGGPGVDTHWFISEYEDGTTEGGSSGSGLWDPATRLLVGTLTGGTASCSSLTHDCYGRLARQWTGGGASSSRLSNWLDPAGTGAPTREGSYATPTITLDAVAFTDSCASGAGDGNGVAEPGETLEIRPILVGTGAFTNVRGTMVALSPGVTLVDAQASWPNLATNVPATSLAPHLQVSLASSVACGTTLDFRLDVTASEGGPFQLLFSVSVGESLQPQVPLPINDNQAATSVLAVSQSQAVSGLKVRVVLNHTWVGDLKLELVSPAGTRITLLDRPGVPASGSGCRDDNMDVTFDDASAFDPETRCAGATPWYSGLARPVQALSAFNGQMTDGAWSLVVTDSSSGDTGTLTNWELITNPPLQGTCVPCAGGCAGQVISPAALRVTKGAGASVALSFTGALSSCATGVQVRMAGTAEPATRPGSFPTDPAFADVTGQDLDPAPLSFRHSPGNVSCYYLVVESLPGGAPGPSGSYGY